MTPGNARYQVARTVTFPGNRSVVPVRRNALLCVTAKRRSVPGNSANQGDPKSRVVRAVTHPGNRWVVPVRRPQFTRAATDNAMEFRPDDHRGDRYGRHALAQTGDKTLATIPHRNSAPGASAKAPVCSRIRRSNGVGISIACAPPARNFPMSWETGGLLGWPAHGWPQFQASGGSQGSVPISAGMLTSRSSNESEVATSLWGVPPRMKMLSPASRCTILPPAKARSTQPSSM